MTACTSGCKQYVRTKAMAQQRRACRVRFPSRRGPYRAHSGCPPARRVHFPSRKGPYRAHSRQCNRPPCTLFVPNGSPPGTQTARKCARGGVSRSGKCARWGRCLPCTLSVTTRSLPCTFPARCLPPCTLSGTGELPRVHKLPGSVYGRDADASATVNPSTRPVSLRSRKRLGPEACGQGGGARPRVGKR